MNIENGLEEPMKEISAFNGVCLSLVERIKLETTLDQLKCDIKCDEMQFWGIIYGSEKDYYIAKALYYKGYPQFPKKKYFFVVLPILYSVNYLLCNLIKFQIFTNLILILSEIQILFQKNMNQTMLLILTKKMKEILLDLDQKKRI